MSDATYTYCILHGGNLNLTETVVSSDETYTKRTQMYRSLIAGERLVRVYISKKMTSNLFVEDPTTAVVVCVDFKTGLFYPREVLEHFGKHNVAAETHKMVMMYLDNELTAVLKTEHARRDVYLMAPVHVLKDPSVKLKALSLLELVDGVKSSRCDRCFRFSKHFGKHLELRGLPEDMVVKEMSCERISMQTIF